MPVTFSIALIGSFSMAGLPPFNGFLSKEMFFQSFLNARNLDIFAMETWGTLFPVIAWIASVFTFVYSMIIVFKTFLGKPHPEKIDRKAHEAPIGMLIAPSILAILVVGIFFFPNVIANYLLRPAMVSVYPQFAGAEGLTPHISAWHGLDSPPLLMTIGVVIIGALLYSSLRYWKGVYTIAPMRWSLDTLYNAILERVEGGSSLLTKRYMTGFLRDYLVTYLCSSYYPLVGCCC